MTTHEIYTMPDSELFVAAQLYTQHAQTIGERIITELLQVEVIERKGAVCTTSN